MILDEKRASQILLTDTTNPWYIEKIEQQRNTINIYVDFKKGAKFE
ncbi:hypothetical protein [Petrotoga sp. DB-2]